MNLNEMLEMLESEVTSGMEKKASEKETKVEQAEVPAVAEQFTKSASARREAEELGAKVAQTLLKQAEDEKSKAEEKKEEEKKEEKSESKDEDKEDKDEKDEKSEKSESKENYFEKKEDNMDKKASLVDIITGMLEKSALNEGSDNVAAAGPNLIQADTAALVADQDAIIAPTPGTDGANQGGSVNQILDAIVAKAQSQGAVNPDQATVGSSSGAERQDDDVEKTAAVVALVEAGVDFDQAVDLVKQAEFEIQAEAFEVEKQAAFSALIEAGIDFDDATDLVKEAASKLNMAERANKAIQKATGANSWSSLGAKAKDKAMSSIVGPKARLQEEATDLATGFRGLVHGKLNAGDQGMVRGKFTTRTGKKKMAPHLNSVDKDTTVSRMDSLKHIGRNRIAQGVAGTTAAAGAAAAYQHQKKAAFDELIADGFDFETAANCVSEAAYELGM